MGKILQLSSQPPSKFGFERVKKRRKGKQQGQLNLFSERGGQILHLPTNIGPFEEALLLDERGDSRAEETYRRAVSEGDCVADAYCNLGIIESKAGRTEKAFDCFTKSLELDPRHLESHYNLGNLYFDAGDLRLARMHYHLAAEIEPVFPNLYFNLGLVLALAGDLTAAVATLSRYKELVSEDEGGKADGLLDTLKQSIAMTGRKRGRESSFSN
jgi:tetratricopeptide (TPR) repeat protein